MTALANLRSSIPLAERARPLLAAKEKRLPWIADEWKRVRKLRNDVGAEAEIREVSVQSVILATDDASYGDVCGLVRSSLTRDFVVKFQQAFGVSVVPAIPEEVIHTIADTIYRELLDREERSLDWSLAGLGGNSAAKRSSLHAFSGKPLETPLLEADALPDMMSWLDVDTEEE